jgi:murein L,D-transpeptidase YcbB/YkuD
MSRESPAQRLVVIISVENQTNVKPSRSVATANPLKIQLIIAEGLRAWRGGPLVRSGVRASARVSILLAIICLSMAALTQAGAQATDAPPAALIGADDAAILLKTLADAPSQGFGVNEFDPGPAEVELKSPDPAVRRQGQARLESAVIAYARAQHGGRIKDRFPDNWAIRPAPYDARADFEAALAERRVAEWVATLPPPDARYGRLVQAYARYQRIAARGGWAGLAASPVLKLGATGDRVEALQHRLAVEDSMVPGDAPTPAVYDAVLAAAVSRAQSRYGLNPDGAAGAKTVAALNVPVERRLDQIRANLERWRWTPRSLPAFRAELNIADASLALDDGGKAALTMRAIVGRAAKPTPMFQDHIQAVVFNPPWNVPADIAAKEIWPKIRRDPGYMAREGFVVRPGGGLQQSPGPKCALGTIKFDLSNRFGVYLHDTPARSLFALDSRTLSHGCMRLENPNALAKRLLEGDPAWSETNIDIALLSGKTVRAPLPGPVPVYVFYWTAFVDDQGQVAFRTDAYRWDERLLGLL